MWLFNAEMQEWHPHGLALLDSDLLISCIDYKPDGDPVQCLYPFLQMFTPSLSGIYVQCGAEYLHPRHMLKGVKKASNVGGQCDSGLTGIDSPELKHVHLYAAAGQQSHLLVAIKSYMKLCTALFDIL